MALKITLIDGRIPTIDSKYVKMGNFAALLNRKNSAYIPRIEHYPAA